MCYKTRNKHKARLKKSEIYLSSADDKRKDVLNIYHQQKGLNGLKGVNSYNKMSFNDKNTYYTSKCIIKIY